MERAVAMTTIEEDLRAEIEKLKLDIEIKDKQLAAAHTVVENLMNTIRETELEEHGKVDHVKTAKLDEAAE
jgi:hypothetical protein